ncbi:proteasome 26S subunit [Entophlyctis helioformis]|nr:proteasome 26S subunit [Entophlyctis helioformis]
MALQQALSGFEALKKDFAAPNPDLLKTGQALTRLKILLTELSFLLPAGSGSPDPKELLLAREILEIGALWSIRSKDIPSFERYIAQLKAYYVDYATVLPESARLYTILGLNLLRLLAQNRIAEFHTELETIDPDHIGSNVYIKHPVQIEQCLMEGSYNKVWNARANVPAEEYTFFMDILMGTIRNEIAGCSEKAYTTLPIADATTLLYFKTGDELLTFAKERGWNVNATEKKIYFGVSNNDDNEIPAPKMIRQMLHYAQELEQIV